MSFANLFHRHIAELSTRKTLGKLGEEWAQEEYVKKGYKIIAGNVYNKKGKQAGEIDFIAVDKISIVFVEVKTRMFGGSRFGTWVDAVDAYKQKKLLLAVKMFLQRQPQYKMLRPQIDVCGIDVLDVDKKGYSVTILVNAVEDWN